MKIKLKPDNKNIEGYDEFNEELAYKFNDDIFVYANSELEAFLVMDKFLKENPEYIIHRTIKEFIKNLTLEEMNDVEISYSNNFINYMDDCNYIVKETKNKLDVLINPMHAFWLWSKFSSNLDAGWMSCDTETFKWFLETLKEPKFYLK